MTTPPLYDPVNDHSDEHYLRRLIEISPIACILTNPREADNPIVAANAAFLDLTGYRLADIIGRNCRFLTGPATETVARATLRTAVAEGKSAVVEITNYRRDGSTFRNAVMVAPLFDAFGQVVYYMGSQMDCTKGTVDERKQAADAGIAGLSRRQLEVLRLMARGLRHAEIAREIGITEKTVKMHRGALVQKLGCRTSAEAIRMAVEAGL